MFSRFFVELFSHVPIPVPPDMRVIPCSALDIAQRDMVRTIGLVIDTRLDAGELEHSLWTLVTHKFPRAGARLAFRNKVHLRSFFAIYSFTLHNLKGVRVPRPFRI
jgi:hypothetical protein